MNKQKWPSGVPVFKTIDASIVAGVDIQASCFYGDGYVSFYDPACDCGEFYCLKWSILDLKPLNADARAMLKIAKEGGG